jgi:hypothetical protein
MDAYFDRENTGILVFQGAGGFAKWLGSPPKSGMVMRILQSNPLHTPRIKLAFGPVVN